MGEGQITAKEVAMLFFNGVVCTYGLPRVVLHNRDPIFKPLLEKSLGIAMGMCDIKYGTLLRLVGKWNLPIIR